MKDLFNSHFDKILEVGTLVFIFVFATLMLAFVKNDEMARFIESGAVITILARAFGNKATAPNTTTVTSSVATDPNDSKEKPL